MTDIPERWRWFPEARFGLFIHWGAYSVYGRGEQVLFREHLDQSEYAQSARAWAPRHFDAREWAAVAKRAGMRYAVLTTRHHDGFCLWDSRVTDYTTARQTAGRDFVGEYAEAFRSAGLRVGLYYSLADWRIPAYWEGPRHDPAGWASFRDYVHEQVRELLAGYGPIDVLWFDGAWPRSALEWKSRELVATIRELQPDILINNRLGTPHADEIAAGLAGEETGDTGLSRQLGDFGTPEHHITAENRLWESCQVSTWRLWGYTIGERWRPADVLLDMLTEAAGKGGNLLVNVGPDADGRFPPEFVERMDAIGEWMAAHGECIYGSEPGEVRCAVPGRSRRGSGVLARGERGGMGPGIGAGGRLRPGGRGRAQGVEARWWVPGGPGPVLELPTRHHMGAAGDPSMSRVFFQRVA